jgi:hypothetical protein
MEKLPKELKGEIALQLPYKQVIELCKTSRKMKALCDDEYFWIRYCRHHGFQKLLKSATWKETAEGWSEPLSEFAGEKQSLLGNISWAINFPPETENVKVPSYEYSSVRTWDLKWRDISDEELDEVFIRQPITLLTPYYDKERGRVVASDKEMKMMTVEPDLPGGISIINLLDTIHHEFWGDYPEDFYVYVDFTRLKLQDGIYIVETVNSY